MFQKCETPVRINVVDVNDNLPVFSLKEYHFRLDCVDSPPPFSVGTVEVWSLSFSEAIIITHVLFKGHTLITGDGFGHGTEQRRFI